MSLRQPLSPPPQNSDFFDSSGKINYPWLQWFIAIVNLFAQQASTLSGTVKADTTANQGDVLLVDTSAGDVNITIPAASSITGVGIIRVTKISNDPNSINFIMTGADTLNGQPGGSIATPYQAVAYVSDNVAQWVNVL